MLELFHTPLTVLHVVVCLMVMLVVLIQPGKSGGLGAALGGAGAQQIFGGRGAGNFLTRTTWISASVFFVTSITLAYISTSTGDSLQNLARLRGKVAPTEVAPAAPPSKPEEPGTPAAPATQEPTAQDPATQPATQEPAPAQGSSAAPVEPAPAPADSKPATP